MGTVIVEFRQLRDVGVFSYLDILCLKGHKNGFGEMAMDFGPEEVEPMLDERGCPWTAHVLLWDC